MKSPTRPRECQHAVNAADLCLMLARAQQYGLLQGLTVDVARCTGLLANGTDLGYKPRPDALEDFLKSLAGHLADKPCGG